VKAVIYRIHGRVQGVGFRYFVYRRARTFGIMGYVQNEADGTVTVLAQGSDESLSEFEQELKQGPSLSNVRYVEKWEVPVETYDDFEIR